MPAVTIDNLDISIYFQYARRTQLIEQIQEQYSIREAGGVPAQTIIIDLYPKLKELDILLGVAETFAPWAYFYPPPNFSYQRQSPFTFHRVIPILEETGDEDECEKKLDDEECDSEEEEERGILKRGLKEIRRLNSLMRYIGGRIGQFLQG